MLVVDMQGRGSVLPQRTTPDNDLDRERTHMRFTKSLRMAAAITGLALAVTACGGDDPAAEDTASDSGSASGSEMTEDEGGSDGEAAADLTLVADGTLTVCSEVPYAPFEVEDADAPSGYSGFDIDLMQAIADELGLELAVVNATFDSLTSGAAFAADTCDTAATAMTITEERDENIDFSDGYYNAAQSLAVPSDSDITSLDEVEGNLGVQTGTTGQAYAEENAPETATLVEFESGADLFLALEAGEIVGILQDLPVNIERASETGDIEVIETYETDENYGFAFPEDGAEDLMEAVNGALQTLRDNGTYDEIFNEYFEA